MTGQPSVSVPGATTADGLPVGVLLTGRFGDDARLLAAAAQLERAGGAPESATPRCGRRRVLR